jgi:hypothetical protein
VGVIRQAVVDWLMADTTAPCRRLPGSKHRRVGPKMSYLSPRNVRSPRRDTLLKMGLRVFTCPCESIVVPGLRGSRMAKGAEVGAFEGPARSPSCPAVGGAAGDAW